MGITAEARRGEAASKGDLTAEVLRCERGPQRGG
jgi:hypothetical protein